MAEPFDLTNLPSFTRKLLIASPATVQRLRERFPTAYRDTAGVTRVYGMTGLLATIKEQPGLEDGKVYELDEPDPLSFAPTFDLPPLPPPEMFWAPVMTYAPALRIPFIPYFPSFDWSTPRRLGKADQRRALVRKGLKRRRALRRIPVALRKASGLWPRCRS